MNPRKTFRIAIRKFGPFETAIQKQWQSFRQISGCDLRLETEAFDLHPLAEKLFEKEELKRGEWDVAFVNTDWMGTIYHTKAVLDLAPWIHKNPPEDFPHGWTESLQRFQQFDGEVLGLPYHDGPECLIYRKDLFEDRREREAYEARFGKALKAPETWSEFYQMARFFHRPEEDLYGTVFAAYPDGHNTVYDFCLQLWTRGGEPFDASGRLRLDSPQAIEGLRFYREILNDSTAMHPKAREFDSVQAGLAFAQGEVALMTNWFGFAAMSEVVRMSKVKGRVGIAEIPHAEGCASASLNVYWLLAIGHDSPHADTAYAFLRHCASRAMDKLLTLEGGIGCRKSTWHDSGVNAMIPFYRRLEVIHERAREMPRLRDWPELAAIIDRTVLETINTSKPVESILREAQAKAQKPNAAGEAAAVGERVP